jgi:hypothetical protein
LAEFDGETFESHRMGSEETKAPRENGDNIKGLHKYGFNLMQWFLCSPELKAIVTDEELATGSPACLDASFGAHRNPL